MGGWDVCIKWARFHLLRKHGVLVLYIAKYLPQIHALYSKFSVIYLLSFCTEVEEHFNGQLGVSNGSIHQWSAAISVQLI